MHLNITSFGTIEEFFKPFSASFKTARATLFLKTLPTFTTTISFGHSFLQVINLDDNRKVVQKNIQSIEIIGSEYD